MNYDDKHGRRGWINAGMLLLCALSLVLALTLPPVSLPHALAAFLSVKAAWVTVFGCVMSALAYIVRHVGDHDVTDAMDIVEYWGLLLALLAAGIQALVA